MWLPLEDVLLVIGTIHHTNRELSLEDKKSSSLTSVAKDNLLFEMYEENQSA